ncbi:MAG: tail fiber domain-containing protein [Prevotellaceae bacterium]|nr:tail fiber domain-containing protein [Prevotellaceae bacterium]
MKKNLFLLITLCAAQTGFAQLKVDAAGKVGVGTTPQTHKLEVTGNTLVNGNIYIGGTSNSLATNSNTPLVFKVNNTVAAGSTGSSGNTNVSFGYSALKNSIRDRNTAIGYYTLASNTNGNHNTATGYYALRANTDGVSNIAYGAQALYKNTTGSGNIAIGTSALFSNTTGHGNIAIGIRAGSSANNLSNAIVIGDEAEVTASNQVRIGNSSVTSIGGYAAWTNISDGRTKKNIRANVPGLNFINSLQPVTYNLDPDAIDELLKSDDPKINRHRDSLRAARSSEEKEFEAKSRAAKQKQVQTGFVAQDVEKIAKSIGYDFSGVDVDEKGIYGLRYAEFVVPLVKAVQELSEKNDAKDDAIALLQEQVSELIETVKKQQDIINNTKAVSNAPELKSADKVGGEAISAEPATLFQNTPNPFNQTTEINYYIPENVNSANIYIYDVNGVQQRKISISERGNGATVLQATALQAGIYLYTLICDGEPVDTKQMILTK